MKSWTSTRRAACAPPPKIWISGSGMRDLAAPREIAPQRQLLRRRGGMQHRHRGRDDGVAAEAAPCSACRRARSDGSRSPPDRTGVAAGKRRGDHRRSTFATARRTSRPPNAAPPSRRSTASPAAGRGAGRRDRAADGAAGERDLDLDGRAAARIPDAAAVHAVIAYRPSGHALPFSGFRAAPPRRSRTAASARRRLGDQGQRGRPDALPVGIRR